MKSYLLDTSAYSNMVRGHADMAKIVRESDKLALSLVTIAELRYGFACGNRKLENEKLLARFLASHKVHLLLPDQLTVDEYAAIGAHAKKQGSKLAHHDLWLVSQAVQHDMVLVSFDQDFTHLTYPGFALKFLK